MTQPLPSSLPEPHARFLGAALAVLQRDERIVGVAVGGSFLASSMDEFSDLDLVLATEPAEQQAVMADRQRVAESLGPLLAAFTGEHVGEPRLLICLYAGAPPLHVDLKFVALPDLAERVEDPAILWQRGQRLSAALAGAPARFPEPDPQWLEDRFWVWVHYGATKIGRGELFEALGFLAFLRGTVLGPLALLRAQARPTGVRKLELLAPEYARPLRATVAAYDADDCARALRACIDAYRLLRADGAGLELRAAAERAAVEYLTDVAERRGR